MPTDLESQIRTALHERAAQVTPRLTAPQRAQRSDRRWLPPLLAAAAVVVLAVAIAVTITVGHGSGSDTGGSAAGAPAYAGYQWRVSTLQDRDGLLVVPPDIDATVAFTTGGMVYANDTVNSLSATYVPGDNAYTVENAGSTLVGYAGGDRTRDRVILAVNNLFFSGTLGTPGGPLLVTIVAAVQGDTLTLHTAGTEMITVTLTREGTVRDQPTQPVSSTPSASTDVLPSATGSVYESGPASP